MDGEDIGDEFKGYVFKIMGGQDKQGFSMKQGVLTQDRVRLMMSKGAPLPALTVGAGGGRGGRERGRSWARKSWAAAGGAAAAATAASRGGRQLRPRTPPSSQP